MFIGNRTRDTKLDPYAGDSLSDDYILDMARQALTRPSDSYWHDDRIWNTHTFMFASAPDSDDLVSKSNYRRILEDMLTAYPRNGMIEASGFGHWTYSHFDAVLVRVTYANGEVTPAFADALAIAYALEHSYPVYVDDDYSELESAEWDRAIEDAIDWVSKQDDAGEWDQTFKESVLDYLYSENAELIGYHDVGYIPEETFERAVAYARDPQLHQTETLY